MQNLKEGAIVFHKENLDNLINDTKQKLGEDLNFHDRSKEVLLDIGNDFVDSVLKYAI
jgi:hypothetical protein